MSELLEVTNVSKSFGGVKALDGVSLSVAPQQIVALIGPNGAGKTTLFNVCTGFLRPDGGDIRFNGYDLTCLPPHRITLLGIARTFQDLRLIRQMTVLENVLLSMPRQVGEGVWGAVWGRRSAREERVNRERAAQWLEFVGLVDKANDLAEALSYGQQKLLSLACCLATGAELLLLDEPVAGLDPDILGRMLSLLKELVCQGKTIFLIEHNLLAVQQVSDWVIVMDEGRKVTEGSVDGVLQDPRVLEAYLT